MATFFDTNGVNLTSFGGNRLEKNTVAITVTSDRVEVIMDGVDGETYSASSYSIPSTQLELGKDVSGNYLNGCIKSFYYYPIDVSSAQLKALSTRKETKQLPPASQPNFVFTIRIPTANTTWNLRSTGTVNYDVDWGDGQTEIIQTSNTKAHTYATPGNYIVVVTIRSGVFRPFFANTTDTARITSIISTGTGWSFGTDLYESFSGGINIFSIENINTAGVTNFDRAWQNLSSLISFPVINTSSVTNFGTFTGGDGAWRGCSSLTSFPLLDFSSALYIAGAWFGCSSLTNFPLINTAGVLYFGGGNQGAWAGCSSLTSFPLINTSNGLGFENAWKGCSSLTSFPLLNFSASTNITNTWGYCSSLTSFPFINTASVTAGLGSATGGAGTWRNCSNLTSFPALNLSNVTGSIAGAWAYCSGLTSFPAIDFPNVTSFGEGNQGAWTGCTSLTSFPLINTSAGTSFDNGWGNCSGLTSFPLLNFSNAININRAWLGCTRLTSFPVINTSKVTSMYGTWQHCTGLTSFPVIDTSLVTTLADLYTGAWLGCTGLTSFPALNLSNCVTFGRISNAGAWTNCSSLTSFPQISFNSGLYFYIAWSGCTSLTTFPANCFNNTPGVDFTSAWTSCALTAQSIENILVSINTANTSTGILGINAGTNAAKTTWTNNANTAYNALIARGWTISFNP